MGTRIWTSVRCLLDLVGPNRLTRSFWPSFLSRPGPLASLCSMMTTCLKSEKARTSSPPLRHAGAGMPGSRRPRHSLFDEMQTPPGTVRVLSRVV